MPYQGHGTAAISIIEIPDELGMLSRGSLKPRLNGLSVVLSLPGFQSLAIAALVSTTSPLSGCL